MGWGWGRGGEGIGEGWRGSLFQVGVQPGLEAVQGVRHHDLLRQAIPVRYISREETTRLSEITRQGASLNHRVTSLFALSFSSRVLHNSF